LPRLRVALPCIALLLIAIEVRAETAYPMLMSIKPVAAAVGQTSEHTMRSRYTMVGAYQILVTGTGVTGEVVQQEFKPEEEKNIEGRSLKVKFTVAADALPGVRDVRVATPRGVSTVGQLVIVR